MTDYPQGDGQVDCPKCKGRGVVPLPFTTGELVGRTQPCDCVLVRDVAFNIERGWRGLLAAEPVTTSPLKKPGLTEKNLRITGSRPAFRSHMKHLAARMPPSWGFLVVSDADLMDAWLSFKLDVRDADIDQMRQKAETHRFAALVDLVEPPTLLVIICGVKAARNEAMPEVLLEALRHREHLNKATWIVDQPSYPLRAGPGDYRHISFNHNVGDFLEEWERVILPLEGESIDLEIKLPVRKTTQKPKANKQGPTMPNVFALGELDEAPPSDPSPHLDGTRNMLTDMDGIASEKSSWKRGRK